jgi:cytoskeletal protein RodZ
VWGGIVSDAHDQASSVARGELLRRAREKAGLTTGDVAARLKLREAFVIAVEAGDGESQMPDPYYTSHLRAMADLLDVDFD